MKYKLYEVKRVSNTHGLTVNPTPSFVAASSIQEALDKAVNENVNFTPVISITYAGDTGTNYYGT